MKILYFGHEVGNQMALYAHEARQRLLLLTHQSQANYMRHATRESSIQKTLDHCRVVRL